MRISNRSSWIFSFILVLVRTWLWRSAFKFIPNKPWRKISWIKLKPFIEFRMETAYGHRTDKPTSSDTVRFLKWCKSFNDR